MNPLKVHYLPNLLHRRSICRILFFSFYYYLQSSKLNRFYIINTFPILYSNKMFTILHANCLYPFRFPLHIELNHTMNKYIDIDIMLRDIPVVVCLFLSHRCCWQKNCDGKNLELYYIASSIFAFNLNAVRSIWVFEFINFFS